MPRYEKWFLESSQSAECIECDGRVTADDPGDLDQLLALIEAHVCDLGPNKGKRSVVEDA